MPAIDNKDLIAALEGLKSPILAHEKRPDGTIRFYLAYHGLIELREKCPELCETVQIADNPGRIDT